MSIAALKVRGPYRGATGYEHHTREFVRELAGRGVAVQLEHVDAWTGSPKRAGFLDPWYESLTTPIDARIGLQFCMPHQVEHLSGLIDVNFTMFEANRIPPLWVSLSKLIDWTIVPNEFCRAAWINSGAPEERIRVCPLGVRSELFAGVHEPMPITLGNGRPFGSYRARFLNISAWNERKNTEGLIQAWLKATRATDDAALIIKLDMEGVERAPTFADLLADCERWANRSLSSAAPIHVMSAELLDSEMPSFYSAATHYISMTHGEGWDLPMMEATATGLIPIAPDHSAYRTYLSPDVAIMIPSREVAVPIFQQFGWFHERTWWNPDERAMSDVIRAVIDDDLAPPASARDWILGEFTWRRTCARLMEILEEVDSISPAPTV